MDQIATFLPGILLAYGAFLLVILSPGPNILAVIGNVDGFGAELRNGWGVMSERH